jgi:quercetin dioxygenase-like cupin family protein
MKLTATSFAMACALATLPASQTLAQQQHSPEHQNMPRAGEHIMLAPSELTWADLPSLPGVKIAVIEGPLNQAVPIMFRLKFPPNFKVPPHWHPGVEHITIISGTLHMGIGSVFDTSKTRPLTAGSVSIMQPGTHHFVWTNEETIGQVHSIGPWSVNYVNPADDPAKK